MEDPNPPLRNEDSMDTIDAARDLLNRQRQEMADEEERGSNHYNARRDIQRSRINPRHRINQSRNNVQPSDQSLMDFHFSASETDESEETETEDDYGGGKPFACIAEIPNNKCHNMGHSDESSGEFHMNHSACGFDFR